MDEMTPEERAQLDWEAECDAAWWTIYNAVAESEGVMSEETKRPDIDAIEARAEKATPGPWSRVKNLASRYWTLGRIVHHVAEPLEEDADWDFAEHAREDIPALLAYVRALEAREREGVEIFDTLLESPLAWEGSGWRCRYCGKPGSPQAGIKHAPDCDWLRARAWLDGAAKLDDGQRELPGTEE